MALDFHASGWRLGAMTLRCPHFLTQTHRLAGFLILLGTLVGAAPQEPGPAARLGQSIRQAGLDPEECYRVRDLSYYREDLKIYFHEGFLIFSKPVLGERLSVVFSGDVDGGDGEIILFPPHKGERQSMAKFTQSPNLDEHFLGALLVFTDNTAHDLYERITQEGAGKKAPEMGPVLAESWNSTAHNITENFDLRLITDLTRGGAKTAADRNRSGFLFMAIAGKRLGNFDVIHDPRLEEQLLVGQLTDGKAGMRYDVWTQFPSRSNRSAAVKMTRRDYSLPRYKIDASISQDLKLRATVSATVRILSEPVRVLAFEVSRAIQVTSAKVDGKPAELMFRESTRERAMRPDQNDAFLVSVADALAPGSEHIVEFEQEGSVITSAGKGVYFVQARSNWYPQNGVSFSAYDLTFRHPRSMNLVAPGELKSETAEDDMSVTRYVTQVPIRVAGFNLGEYQKVSESGPGFSIDVYGNRHLEYALVPKARDAFVLPNPPGGFRGPRPTAGTAAIATLNQSAPDPLGRLRETAADAAACFQYFSGLFGTPAISTLTIAPVPGSFGQGFPGLVYLSTLAYIDPTERPTSIRGSRDQTFYSDMIQAHEIAHQWWGNVVVPAGYQDEWIVEGLSNYSALMWMEKKKGPKAVEQTLTQYRDDLLTKDEGGKTYESAGPITWGYRIEASTSGVAFRAITYEKGAWIFHMLRQRMGDDNFLKMLRELRRRYEFQSITTGNLSALVKEFLPPKVSKNNVDLFFDNWVYSSGIPSLKMSYSVKGAAGQWKVVGTVEQSGVDPDFSTEVPIEIQFAQGPSERVWVETGDEAAPFAATLKQLPAKVALGLGTTVLAARK
jgi:hypothetical protein